MDIFFQQLECWKALKPQLSDVVMIYRGLYFLEAYVTSIIIILELWRAFGPTLKISLGKCFTLNFVFIFFVHQCWLYKKPTEKMLVTFILGNKNYKRAWRFPIKTLPTTVCIDFSYNKAQLFIPLQVFCSFEIHLQIHTIFFFTFSESVVVGIVYKDLHDVLITDQPFRTITGATRWGYLLQFLN